ncbi:MAG: repeat protein [Symbiobacteriaceae bacterium]|jgi:hypothetical protein|nr:repeat protein [Symbiobacteriaceae bacterium]
MVMRIDFGFTRLGRRSRARTVTIPNRGEAPFYVDRVELVGPYAGEFRVVAEDCSGVEVWPGRSCSIDVRFTPAGSGVRRAVVLLHTDTPGSPWRVILTGYAPAARARTPGHSYSVSINQYSGRPTPFAAWTTTPCTSAGSTSTKG